MNTKEYIKLRHHYIINNDSRVEQPNVYLMDRRLNKLGQLESVEGLSIDVNFQEPYSCTFKTYKYNNGNEEYLWDKIKDLSVILIEGFGLFQIKVPLTDGEETIVKDIEGTALSASELGQLLITIEVNTESDLDGDNVNNTISNVKSTIFWNETDKAHSLIHRIMKSVPTYTIGHVDESLKSMQRTLQCEDAFVYDFLMNDVSEAFGCIFLFDPYDRIINIYDINDHCLDCGSHHIIDGVCQDCKHTNIEEGYGIDSSIYVDTENFAKEIQLTGDNDSVKNCFKIKGGDDVITDLISQRLIGDGNRIWSFSDDMLKEMTPQLQSKYLLYCQTLEQYQAEYNTTWDNYNEAVNKITYLEHSKMPTTGISKNSTPTEVWNNVTSNITYTCIGSKNTTLDTLSKNILNDIKIFLPAGYDIRFAYNSSGKSIYSCNYSTDSNGDSVISSWTGSLYLYVKNDTDETGKDKHFLNISNWVLDVKAGYNSTPDNNNNFTNDYYLYLQQLLRKRLAKLEIKDIPELNQAQSYYSQFSINRLESYKSAFDTCVTILYEFNSSLTDDSVIYHYILENGTVSPDNIVKSLIGKYKSYSNIISDIIATTTAERDSYVAKKNVAEKRIKEIKEICDIRNILGDDLYKELLSFSREQVYENSNYTSETISEELRMKNIEELIKYAKEEINKAKEVHYSASISMGNLLSQLDYSIYYYYFSVGNFIRLRIDDKLVKIRIIGLNFNFESWESIDVTFSDALLVNAQLNDVQSIISSASSMATSMSYLEKQSELNKNKISNFNSAFSQGLAEICKMVNSATGQVVTIDEAGYLGRKWNEDEQAYDKAQIKIINNCIAFTDDYWNSVKTAIGYTYFNGEWKYGIIADRLVGQEIIGSNLTITNDDQTMLMNNDGIHLFTTDKKNTIDLNASNCSMVIKKDNKTKLSYTPENGLYIDGNGVFRGNLDIVQGDKYIKLDASVPRLTIGDGDKVLFDSNNEGKVIIDVENSNLSEELGGNWKNTIVKDDYLYFKHTRAESIRFFLEDKWEESDAGNLNGTIEIRPYTNGSGTESPSSRQLLLWRDSYFTCCGHALFANSSTVDFEGTVDFSGAISVTGNINTASDFKLKKDIEHIDKSQAMNFITTLSPVYFKYKNNSFNRTHMGFVAQDVKEVCDKSNMADMSVYDARIKNEDGSTSDYVDGTEDEKLEWSLKYTEFIAPMVSCIQLLNEKLENVEKELKEIKNNG